MSEQFKAAEGRRVVSRASAEKLGTVSRLLVDADCRRIASVIVGKRRKARLIDWDSLSGFGADAVMVADEAALREPQDARDEAAVHGDLELLGRRVLSDAGNELGEIEDVIFDPQTGALEALVVGGEQEPAAAILGAGSYAVILRAP